MILPEPISYQLSDEAATVALGRQLALSIAKANGSRGLCIYLLGDLGAGKTTLSRGIIQAFGHTGAVKSPTYTLVEPYKVADSQANCRLIYHFDLYRLADAAELEFLGLDDYFTESSLCLVEWPARGAGFIPEADITLTLSDVALLEGESASEGQSAVIGRQLNCQFLSPAGEQVLLTLQANYDSALAENKTANALNSNLTNE